MTPLSRALVAGAVAGVAGVAAFLPAHATWILPIWSVAPIAIPLGALAGVALGWAAEANRDALPRAPVARGAALVLLAVLWIAAAQIPGLVRPVEIGVVESLPPRVVVARLVAGLALGTLAGVATGLALLRPRRGVIAFGVAAFGVALTIGHNAPFVGLRPEAATLWLVQGAALATAGAAFVAAEAALASRGADA